MCTLILGLDTVARGSVILAANRDEDPARPSVAPGLLSERPRVAGGRDALKGGSWLAIREKRAAVAMLNRRDEQGAAGPARRSRGLLALEVAAAGDGSPEAALAFARAAAGEAAFAPFSLLFASPAGCWLLANERSALRPVRIAPGWHAITHADLDEPAEPRTRWLLGRLGRFAPRSASEAERGLLDLLRSHGSGSPAAGRVEPATGSSVAPDPEPAPPVCLHEGRMRTVSSSIVWLAGDGARYVHIEGRPCTGEPLDCSHLLDAGLPARHP